MIAYHFVDKTLRDGRAIPPDGEWLEDPLPLEMCSHGLHASLHVADALKYAPGSTLCLVELGGEIIKGDDKVVAQRRRILARFDATELLRADACASALSVLHLWNAPPIVRQYLETGDLSLRVHAANAYAAAYAAARAAAYAAYADADAYAAARAAAYAATYADADADAARAAAYAATYAAAHAAAAAYAATYAAAHAAAAAAYAVDAATYAAAHAAAAAAYAVDAATYAAAHAAAAAAYAVDAAADAAHAATAAAYAVDAAADAARDRLQKAVDDKFGTVPMHAYFMRTAT
jgi:hypothetical protein